MPTEKNASLPLGAPFLDYVVSQIELTTVAKGDPSYNCPSPVTKLNSKCLLCGLGDKSWDLLLQPFYLESVINYGEYTLPITTHEI